MSQPEKQQYWNGIIAEAYASRTPITQWCAEHNISSNNFHRWAKKLGYTEGGKKTEKCLALVENQANKANAISTPIIPTSPLFVEVSAQTRAHFTSLTEISTAASPLITINTGNYQIGIRDGFNEQTLSKVLEVVRYA